MKIKVIKNVDRFFETVDKCKGQVHVKSSEGDDIVLTSKLSRIIFTIINDDQLDHLNLELVCENPEDTILFIEYLAGE